MGIGLPSFKLGITDAGKDMLCDALVYNKPLNLIRSKLGNNIQTYPFNWKYRTGIDNQILTNFENPNFVKNKISNSLLRTTTIIQPSPQEPITEIGLFHIDPITSDEVLFIYGNMFNPFTTNTTSQTTIDVFYEI